MTDHEPHEKPVILARQCQVVERGRPRWRTVHLACARKDVAAYEALGYVVVFREPEPETAPLFNPPHTEE